MLPCAGNYLWEAAGNRRSALIALAAEEQVGVANSLRFTERHNPVAVVSRQRLSVDPRVLVAADLGAREDACSKPPEPLWVSKSPGPVEPSLLYHRGLLYSLMDNGVLTCLDGKAGPSLGSVAEFDLKRAFGAEASE